MTTVQVAANANLESSCFFILKGDPTYIENLAADTITANTIVGSTLDANTELLLNSGTLTVAGGQLLLNGTPVGGGGDVSDWSSYPATSAVNVAGYAINNATNINALDVSSSPIVLSNPYALTNAAGSVSTQAVVITAGDYRADASENGVGLLFKKTITRGVVDNGIGENIGQIQFMGKDTTNADTTYGIIRGVCTDPTNGSEYGRLNMFVRRAGAGSVALLQIDGSGNKVSIEGDGSTVLDMNSRNIQDVKVIRSADVSNATAGVQIQAPYQLGANDPCLILDGGNNRSDVSNNAVNMFIRKNIRSGAADESIGQLNFSGLTSTGAMRQLSAINTTAYSTTNGSETVQLNMSARRNGTFTKYLQIDGSANRVIVTQGGLDCSGLKVSNLGTPTDASDATTKAYVDAATAAGGSGWSTFPATQTVNMGTYGLSNIGSVSNASGTLNIGGDDLNLNCTGVTSVLNITSALGTAIIAGGAVDITAGGTTAINSTGNVTIGSLGTTSIENFNLNNSVLTKVPATADLELNNISKIFNSNATIDISGTQVNVEDVAFVANTIAKKSGASDLIINNIAEFNVSTAGSVINSKAAINVDTLSGLTDFAAYSAQNLTASTGDVAGVFVNQVESLAGDATGASVIGVTANTAAGSVATGVAIQTVLGVSSATGLELSGSMAGTTKRGIYEHFATSGVINTLSNNTGIGTDPSGVKLDVLGQSKFTTTTGGRVNPTIQIVTTDAAGVGAYAQFYHNSATPAVGDRCGVMDFYGNNASGIKQEFARFRTLQQGNTNGSENGEIEMSVVRNGSMTTYLTVDASENGVIVNPDTNISTTSAFRIYDSGGVTANNTLMYADASNSRIMMKNYPQRFLYDISGTYTLTLPAPGFNIMRMVSFGAGGGGGSGRLDSSGTCYGGGAGGGGNGGEFWFDRQELSPDASGDITFYITIGKGGDGGASQTVNATNGNNGGNGGQTVVYVTTNGASNKILYYQLTGGNGGSGGTAAAGNGGGGATWSGGGFGSSGRAGSSSSITGQPGANTAVAYQFATNYNATGGSGAGGGVNAAATTAYQGGGYVSPAGQFYNGFTLAGGIGGNAGTAVLAAGNGQGASYTGYQGQLTNFLRGGVDQQSGGGGSVNATSGGGNGGEIAAGSAGGRGSGGGGGGGALRVQSGKGGKGADGMVYFTFW
jgi:hypothetical protein